MCVKTKLNYIFFFSNPGDVCVICLEIMQIQTLEKLSCGHAMHSLPCFNDWITIRNDSMCPHCYAEI